MLGDPMIRFIHVLSFTCLIGLPLAGCNNDVAKDDFSSGDGDGDGDGDADADADADADGDDTGSTGTDDTGDGTDSDGSAPVDADGDGYTGADGDCDDLDDTVHPDADEVCDGIDNNCNDEVDEDPINGTIWYADADADGFGDPDVTTQECDQPDGHVAISGDCSDGNGLIHPDADEVCDDMDNDCDDLVDTDDVSLTGGTLAYLDADGDSFGEPGTGTVFCTIPDGYSATGDDCDDTETTVHPYATEICDEMDNDCDALTDEDDTDWVGGTEYYADTDGDGFGDPESTVEACEIPSGYVTNSMDCDDDYDDTHPYGIDYCGDDRDNNCSGDETDCTTVTVPEVHDMIVCDGTPEALRVEGAYFDISYNIHGLWNDPSTAMGFQMSDGSSWADVTYPGWAFAVQMFSHNYDAGDGGLESYRYSDGAGGTLDDWAPDCANTVEVGNIIGVIHEYTLDHVHVVKTELWNKNLKVMRVWYEMTNIADDSLIWPAMEIAFDPDIDSDLYGESETELTITDDQRYMMARGPESGWAFGIGICDGYLAGIHGIEWPEDAGSSDPSEYFDTCNPDGLTMDVPIGWTKGALIAPSDTTEEFGYIISSGTGWLAGLSAMAAYEVVGPGLCEMDEVDWVDDVVTSTVCVGPGSIPDFPDFSDMPDMPDLPGVGK